MSEVPEYRLIRLLASGVSGDVYRARRASDEKILALKVYHTSVADAPELANRTIQSAFRAKEFADAAAVKIYECIAAEGRLMLATELVEGEVLARALQRNTRLPAKSVLAVLKRAGQFFAAASAAGLHHGRLSPAKLFVAPSGRLLILGTGLFAGRHTTAAHPAGYTWPLHYVAPEVLDGAPTAEPADVYALGVVAYHLLCGISPFASERLPALKIEKVSRLEWPAPVAQAAPRQLLLLIERMAAPRAVDRLTWPQVVGETAALLKPRRQATAPRVRQAVPEEEAVRVLSSDEAPAARQSPFMLPVLLSLLFLVCAAGVILRSALTGAPEDARKPAQASHDVAAPAASQDAPAEPPPEPSAPPPDAAHALFAAVEQLEKAGSTPPHDLAAEYERIAAEHPASPWAAMARLAASRIKAEMERQRTQALGDLRKRTAAAVADFRPAEAIGYCDELSRAMPELADARAERERVIAGLPALFAQIQTTAELYAAGGDYQAAAAWYQRVLSGFPAGEWQAKATLAIARLRELEERRNETEEAARRRQAAETEKATYETAVKRARDEAAAFRYAKARLHLEQAYAQVTDTALKRALNLYREAVQAEEKYFQAAAERLAQGTRSVAVRFDGGAGALLANVKAVSEQGLQLHSDEGMHILCPWSRLGEYDKLRVFQLCMFENNADEYLALASIAFHRGLFWELDDFLNKAAVLGKGQVADTATALRTLFKELEPLFRPTRPRNR